MSNNLLLPLAFGQLQLLLLNGVGTASTQLLAQLANLFLAPALDPVSRRNSKLISWVWAPPELFPVGMLMIHRLQKEVETAVVRENGN